MRDAIYIVNDSKWLAYCNSNSMIIVIVIVIAIAIAIAAIT